MARTFGSIPADEAGWSDTPGGGVVVNDSGLESLVNGQANISVTFNVVQADATWIYVDNSVINTTDVSPLNISAGITTAKSASGFTLQLSAAPDSSNYVLSWAIGTAASAPSSPPQRITSAGDFRITSAGDFRITT